MSEELILSERCGPIGTTLNYTGTGSSSIGKYESKDGYVKNSFCASILECFRELLLPSGYPESVSEDYLEYQIWDTVQAFCSTITGIFTTQAILKGVGVGNAAATPLAATITWILKDGAGMVGRIVFAWWKGNSLDCDCKKWRLFADVINDGAMIFELCLPYAADLSMQILCMSTIMKSLVGVAGGATRASISNHQAVKDNMAEISAKDGSQETIVNLIASLSGLFLLNHFNTDFNQWFIVTFFMIMHLYANYRAVCALVFKSLNNSRLNLILKTFLEFNAVLQPTQINRNESVFLGITQCNIRSFSGFDIVMGKSLQTALKSYNSGELQQLTSVYKERKYFLLSDIKKKRILVSFEKGEEPLEVIGAYYHAVLLALTTQIYNKIPIKMSTKRHLHYSTPLTRLCSTMKSLNEEYRGNALSNVPIRLLLNLNDLFNQEKTIFFSALKVNGWQTEQHSLYVDEWRSDWKHLSKKSLKVS